jgi:putative ABC transport system permease protein
MVDERYMQDLTQSLRDRPRVASMVSQDRAIKSYMDTAAEMLLVYTFILSLFAGVIAFGVVYNSARISLSERDRELASLRVLGFTKGEISYILLGELAVLVMLAIPFGFILGALAAIGSMEALQTDMYQFPVIFSRKTFAVTALVVITATVISSLLLRRKINQLDLVKVLKTRE